MVDQQSFLNVWNLAVNGKVSEDNRQSFARLFDLLGLPPAQLETLVENLRFASDRSASNGSSPLAPLMPQRVEQLVWLGLPANTVAVLQPYITILQDSSTPVNLNTASAEVIYAAVHGLTMADAQRLVAVRERAPFRSPEDARAVLGAPNSTFSQGQVGGATAGVSSRFFEVRSRLRLDQLVVEERALVQRDGTFVRVLQRVRGAPQPDNAPGAATGAGASNGPGASGMGQR
jgi:general secretion pathway protein K